MARTQLLTASFTHHAGALLLVALACILARSASGWGPGPPDWGFDSFGGTPLPHQKLGLQFRGSGPSKEEQLRQSGRCCNAFGGGRSQCFDLERCPGAGGAGASAFGFGFGFPSFGGSGTFDAPDFELQAVCGCMQGSGFGELCCKGEDLSAPSPDPAKRPGNDPEKKIHTLAPAPAPSAPPPPPSKDDSSIHSVEWTPATKSDVLRHRNLRLLPGLDSCGVRTAPAPRAVGYVVGGHDATLGEYPWMALLGIVCNNPEFDPLIFGCGGTLISQRYVLTASHCVTGLPKGCKVGTLRLGEFDQRNKEGKDKDCQGGNCAPPVQDVDVEEVVQHAGYDTATQANDIALVRLAKPAQLGPYVTPICLPMHDFAASGTRTHGVKLTVAGWGRTVADKEPGSDILQEVKVPLVSATKCQEYFQPTGQVIGDAQFCAGGDKNKDSCQGDSGGPIMGTVALKPSSLDGAGDSSEPVRRMVQLGVVSFGRKDSMCSMAGEGHLTLYAKVAHYLPWILDHIRP